MPTSVVRFAVCSCDKGSAPTALMVAATPSCVNGQISATIVDKQFVGTFGECKKLHKECDYAPAASWTQPTLGVLLTGQPPLVQGAKLKCDKGGMITVLDPGQSTVCIEQQMDATRAEIEALKDDLRETMLSLGLDLAGTADPTPTTDVLSGLNSIRTGDWTGAALSGVSAFPYLGDTLAKPAKIGKVAKKLNDLREAISKAKKVQKTLKTAYDVTKKHEGTIDKVKNAKTIYDMKKGIDTTGEIDSKQQKLDGLGDDYDEMQKNL